MALEKIKVGEAPSGEWINESMKTLKNAGRSYGETELAVISEIESLVKQQMIPLPASYPAF